MPLCKVEIFCYIGAFKIDKIYSMTRKVLHLMASLNTGGAENLVLDMLTYNNSLPQNKKIDFYLVYSVESEQERVALFNNLFSNDRLYFIKGGKGLKNTLGFILKLRNFLKKHRIEQIHCHNNVDAYWAAVAIAPIEPAPTIMLTVHGLNLNFNYIANKVKSSKIMPLFFKLFAGGRIADSEFLDSMRLTFVSGATKQFYIEQFASRNSNLQKEQDRQLQQIFTKGDVITNGILPQKLLSAKPYDNLLKTLGINCTEKRPFLMGMVGNFNTNARLQLMICKSLSLLPDKISFRFVFVGKKSPAHPEYYDDCVNYCKENGLGEKVIFAGQRSDVPQILKSLDCYVYGSAADTFGLSVIEAVISGLPVICSDIPALREVLLNGSLGTLVNNTPDAFAYTIKREYNRLAKDGCANESCNIGQLTCEAVDKQELALMHYSIDTTFSNYYL